MRTRPGPIRSGRVEPGGYRLPDLDPFTRFRVPHRRQTGERSVRRHITGIGVLVLLGRSTRWELVFQQLGGRIPNSATRIGRGLVVLDGPHCNDLTSTRDRSSGGDTRNQHRIPRRRSLRRGRIQLAEHDHDLDHTEGFDDDSTTANLHGAAIAVGSSWAGVLHGCGQRWHIVRSGHHGRLRRRWSVPGGGYRTAEPTRVTRPVGHTR